VIHQDFLRFVHVDDQEMLENNLKKFPSPPEQVREIFKPLWCVENYELLKLF
jgi:hypothetical protein